MKEERKKFRKRQIRTRSSANIERKRVLFRSFSQITLHESETTFAKTRLLQAYKYLCIVDFIVSYIRRTDEVDESAKFTS